MNMLATATGFKVDLLAPVKDKARETVVETTKEVIVDVLVAVCEVAVDLIGAISLIGGGILILSKVVGFDKGYKYASLLFFINVLVKYLFSGGLS